MYIVIDALIVWWLWSILNAQEKPIASSIHTQVLSPISPIVQTVLAVDLQSFQLDLFSEGNRNDGVTISD